MFYGKTIDVTDTEDSVDPADYDALMLPGGVMNSDKLCADKKLEDLFSIYEKND